MIQRLLTTIGILCLGSMLMIQFQNCAPYEAAEFEPQVESGTEINRQALSYSNLGKSDIRGGVLGLDRQGNLYYWAMDLMQPEKKLRITLKINGSNRGSATCNNNHPFMKELLQGPASVAYVCIKKLPSSFRRANTGYLAELYNGSTKFTSQSYNPSWQLTGLKGWRGVSGDVWGDNSSENINCGAACKVRGRLGNDNLVGSNSNDSIWANGGNDILYGHGGNDHLDGGNGDDKIIPGPGHDTIVFKQNASSSVEFNRIVQNESNADVLTCPTEKATHCIDYYSQRILLFPSKSAVTLEGARRSGTNVTNCIRRCTYMSGLYPGRTIVYDGGASDKNKAKDHIKGTSASEIMLPRSGKNTLLEGGGGNDTYVLQNTTGHHEVLDKSGSNSIRCLNMRVVKENMEDGVRISWDGGSLNIPHHSEATFRKSNGQLNADCQFISKDQLGQGVL